MARELKAVTNEFVEELDGVLKDGLKAAGFDPNDLNLRYLGTLEPELAVLVVRYFKLLNLSYELIETQAEVMDDMNKKLDAIIAKQNKVETN